MITQVKMQFLIKMKKTSVGQEVGTRRLTPCAGSNSKSAGPSWTLGYPLKLLYSPTTARPGVRPEKVSVEVRPPVSTPSSVHGNGLKLEASCRITALGYAQTNGATRWGGTKP